MDMGASSFTVNDERLQTVDFVTYFEAGIQWASAAGTDVDPDEEEHPDNPGHAAYLARGDLGHEGTGSSADADLDDPDVRFELELVLRAQGVG